MKFIKRNYDLGVKLINSHGKIENADGTFSLPLRFSLSGPISRVKNTRSIKEAREEMFIFEEFARLYVEARKCFIDGDLENVGRFFTLFAGDK